jgi:hypothetical protein
MVDEQVAILERRLPSKQLLPPSTLLDHMINNIDTIASKPNDVVQQSTSTTSLSHQLEKMKQLKHDIIYQSITTGRKIIESFGKVVLDEKQKYSFNENGDVSPQENQTAVINAIEIRRLHMIKRVKYMTEQKLVVYFNDNQSYKT